MPRFTNLSFVHSPKTGTSLTTTLRNYLDACPVKDFPCPGYDGGGFVGWPSTHSLSFADLNLTNADVPSAVYCSGALRACQPTTVHQWWTKGTANPVTMLREPVSRLRSVFEHIVSPQSKASQYAIMVPTDPQQPLRLRPVFTSMLEAAWPKHWWTQAAMITGNLGGTAEQPMKMLNTQYVWWGLTLHWKTSICIFHCELGGDYNVKELANSRNRTLAQEVATQIGKKDFLRRRLPLSAFKNYTRDYMVQDVLFTRWWSKSLPSALARVAANCDCCQYGPGRTPHSCQTIW